MPTPQNFSRTAVNVHIEDEGEGAQECVEQRALHHDARRHGKVVNAVVEGVAHRSAEDRWVHHDVGVGEDQERAGCAGCALVESVILA